MTLLLPHPVLHGLLDAQENFDALASQRPEITNAPARAHLASAQSIGTGSSKVPLDTEDFDPAGCFDAANHRYVVPADGYYATHGAVAADLNNLTVQTWIAFVFLNGAEACRGGRVAVRGGVAGDLWDMVVAGVVECSAGDTLELWAFNNGPNSTALETVGSTFLSVVRVA